MKAAYVERGWNVAKDAPINLDSLEVFQVQRRVLTQDASSFELRRTCRQQPFPPEMPDNDYQVGQLLWCRERVARRHKEDAPEQWFYSADGYEEGRFYTKNYHMPRLACRYGLVVEATRVEYLHGFIWELVLTVRALAWPVVAPIAEAPAVVLYLLDFDAVSAAARGFRKKPVFQVKELESATTDALHSDTVKYYAYDGWGELRLDMTDFGVRNWLKKLQFTKEPCVLLGDQRIVCAKEVPPCSTALSHV